MEAHANVREMGLMEAKMAYIKAWQSLPEFGITYFRIKMSGNKKEVRVCVCVQTCLCVHVCVCLYTYVCL